MIRRRSRKEMICKGKEILCFYKEKNHSLQTRNNSYIGTNWTQYMTYKFQGEAEIGKAFVDDSTQKETVH